MQMDSLSADNIDSGDSVGFKLLVIAVAPVFSCFVCSCMFQFLHQYLQYLTQQGTFDISHYRNIKISIESIKILNFRLTYGFYIIFLLSQIVK